MRLGLGLSLTEAARAKAAAVAVARAPRALIVRPEDPLAALLAGRAIVSVAPGALAGPSIRDKAVTNGWTDATTVAMPTQVSGDPLYAIFCASGLAGFLPSLNSGWTQVGSTLSVGSGDFAVFKAASTGAGTNRPFSSNPMQPCGTMVISAKDAVTGHDAGTGNTGASTTSIVAPSATANGSTDLQFCVYGVYIASSFNSITVPGSQTDIGQPCTDNANCVFRVGYETLAASGATGTRTATASPANVWAAFNLLVK